MSQKNTGHNCRVAKPETSAEKRPTISVLGKRSVQAKRKEQYYDWDGFSAAIKKLNIRSKEEYDQRFHEDPLLPENPKRTVADFPGWEQTFQAIYGRLQKN